ncbi:MMPL family transporter [Bacteroidia bacterium]|nr:MMPL family transporter [Bacteroidia bacterium]
MLFATLYRKFIIILFLAITGFLGYQLSNIQFGYEMDDFFDKNEQENQFYNSFFEQFDQSMPNAALLGIENGSLIDYEAFLRIDSFSKQLEQLPEIMEVAAVTNLQSVQLNNDELASTNLLDLRSRRDYLNSMQSLDSIPNLKRQFLSEKGNSTVIYLVFKDTLQTDSLLNLVADIEGLAKPFAFQNTHFIDLDYNNHLMVEKIKKDSTRLIIIAIVLMLVLLTFFFRSFMGVVIPITIVIGTVIWIMGTVVLFGIDINALTIAIPVIVSAISLSDVIHIISRYSEEEEGDAFAKIKATQKDILRAIILTTLTTSIGFLSLANSNIPVFQEFGGFTALGVVYALILAYFVLPILLYYSKKITVNNVLFRITPNRIWGTPTLLVTLGVVVICVLGVLRVHHNNYFYQDLKEDDEVGEILSFVELEMNGLRDLTFAITLNDSTASVFDAKILRQLNELERFVESHYPATIEMSLASSVKQVNRSLNHCYSAQYRIPTDDEGIKQVRSILIKNARVLKLRSFVSRDKRATFIKTKTRDQGSYATFALHDSLNAFASNACPDINIAVTGKAHIIDMTNVNVSEGMIWNLGVIVLFIFLSISIIFRSFFIGLFSLIPNILPLFAITATVGLLDFGMNVATTIVYTIAFGIAVDDTIHFLARYKIEKEKGVENKQAVLNSVRTSGAAIILTTIILVAGFGVLVFSHFYANYITGLLVCIGMVMALLCDLFLLPLILSWMKDNTKQ